MKLLLCMIVGYVMGTISPSALLSKVKHVDLRKSGTGNLGATNTLVNFGKGYGVLVMVFDILKAYFAVKLAQWLFPAWKLAHILVGGAAVVGHVFPFYLKFKGGKGLASFGGMILALDPLLFLVLLVITLVLMFACNHGVAMPMSAAVLFPILYGAKTGSVALFLVAAAVSALIAAKHFSNIEKARKGEDIAVRDCVKTYLLRK